MLVSDDVEPARDEVLARLQPAWSEARTEGNLAATVERIGAGVRRRRAWSRALVVTAALLMVGGGVAWRRAHRALPTGDVAVQAQTPAMTAGAPGTLHLKDGSQARPLAAATRLELAVNSAERVEIDLAGGPAAFEVVPARGRSFTVRYAHLQFTVLGTRFRVIPHPEGERAQLVVEQGRVQVTWPGGSDVAGAGTSASFPPKTTPLPSVSSSASREHDNLADSLAVLRSRFHAHVARREYAAAYRSMVAERGVVDNSAEDLMLAADAARLSGHAAESVPYFERLLRDHATDARAPLAAFTVGRVLLAQLARPAQAADMFALARRLAPTGALASDALAREAEAAAAAGDKARARRLASEFVGRHPADRRTRAVQRAGGLE